MLKRLKAGLKGGGVTIDAVLSTPEVYPGSTLQGVVHVTGGELDLEVTGATLSLACKAEWEASFEGGSVLGDEVEFEKFEVLATHRLDDAFELREGARHELPFAFEVPYETPFNVLAGRELPEVDLRLDTALEVHRAVDPADIDPIRVWALPVQVGIVRAFEDAGCVLTGGDVEGNAADNAIAGWSFPVYEELDFTAPAAPGGRVEVVLLPRTAGIEVLAEAQGRPRRSLLTVPWQGWETADLPAQVRAGLAML